MARTATPPSVTSMYPVLLYYTPAAAAAATTKKSINRHLFMPEVVVFNTSMAKLSLQSGENNPAEYCALSFHQTEIWAKPAKRNSLRSHGTFVHIPVILQATYAPKYGQKLTYGMIKTTAPEYSIV